MITSRVTPAVEEERAEVEGVEEEGGTAKAAGSSVSTCGRFNRSWASLHRTKPTLMVPMMVKRRGRGIGNEKCQRICVIAEGKMSLSWVEIS